MKKLDKDQIESMLTSVRIPSEDIPDIGLYMDQITTFMDSKLAATRRYPEDKILTKTMINNYTKNHLLPPSVKKKYSKEHLFMLIFIYHLKNMLSISDIQTLLSPVADACFSGADDNGFSLKEIYDRTTELCDSRFPDIKEDIEKLLDQTRETFDDFNLNKDQEEYLDFFSIIYQLSYDIYVRKQLIEKLIDDYRDAHPVEKSRKKKNS